MNLELGGNDTEEAGSATCVTEVILYTSHVTVGRVRGFEEKAVGVGLLVQPARGRRRATR